MARHGRKYEKKSIEAARMALAGMAKNADSDSVQTKQAVSMLKKEILAARKGGATWAEVVEALHGAGVGVSPRTVMEMVNGGRKKAAASIPAKPQAKVPAQVKATGSVPPPRPGTFVMRPDRDEL